MATLRIVIMFRPRPGRRSDLVPQACSAGIVAPHQIQQSSRRPKSGIASLESEPVNRIGGVETVNLRRASRLGVIEAV